MIKIILLVLFLYSPADKIWELISSEKYEEAIHMGKALLEAGESERELLLALAFAYRVQDSLNEALNLYQKILDVNPDDREALLGRAIVLSYMDRLEESIKTYKQILARNPEDREAQLGLARVLGWASRVDEAISIVDSLLGRNPDDFEALLLRGELETYRDNLKSAIIYYKRASRVQSDNVEVLYKIGQVYEWMGKMDSALFYYRKLLRVDPDYERAKVAVQRIELGKRAFLEIKLTDSEEKDGDERGAYRNLILRVMKNIGPLGLGVKSHISSNFRGDSTRNIQLLIPEIRLNLMNILTISSALGLNLNKNEKSDYWLGAGFNYGVLRSSLTYSREILEPVKNIKLEHIQGNFSLHYKRLELKGNFDRGEVDLDTNERFIYDVTLIVEMLRKPINIKILGSHGAMDYKKWSPYYYSPQNLLRYSGGIIIFKGFKNSYIYFDFSYSPKHNEIPGVTTGSFEAGYGNFYASLSYFSTTERYRLLTLTSGYKMRLFF